MMKYKIFAISLLMGCFVFSQAKPERQHRIRKAQFPTLQFDLEPIAPALRQVKYYKEIDSAATTYSLKFKKDRLSYHLDYDNAGNLLVSGFRVKEVDMPAETFDNIQGYLNNSFLKFKIRRIWQQYPVAPNDIQESPLKSTFQNLLLPSNLYKLLVRGALEGKKKDYEFWFDAEGNFSRMRESLPANFDRILY